MFGLSDTTSSVLIGGVVTLFGLLITNLFGLINQRKMIANQGVADEKLNTIHTLTNSGMTELRGQLGTAMAIIAEMKNSAMMARIPIMPPMPGTLPPPAPDPVPPPRPVPSLVTAAPASVVPAEIMNVATLTGIAAAATSVAEAAVDKKNEIVGKPK